MHVGLGQPAERFNSAVALPFRSGVVCNYLGMRRELNNMKDRSLDNIVIPKIGFSPQIYAFGTIDLAVGPEI
jgi:hypothetical protein